MNIEIIKNFLKCIEMFYIISHGNFRCRILNLVVVSVNREHSNNMCLCVFQFLYSNYKLFVRFLMFLKRFRVCGHICEGGSQIIPLPFEKITGEASTLPCPPSQLRRPVYLSSGQ